jgi:lipoprotein-anchoring transpeptidase ErfK/SrfK
MRFFLAALAACLMLGAPQMAAADRIVARVSISTQTMHVYRDGMLLHEWQVSTARPGKTTPTGQWNGQWLSRNHRSSRYNNAPMPYAIFYSGHYAIHGTDQISRLGRPASAGCVRLHPDHARTLFSMVQQEGPSNLRVVVVN